MAISYDIYGTYFYLFKVYTYTIQNHHGLGYFHLALRNMKNVNMVPCHGSVQLPKLIYHQLRPNTENLFVQQQISETITAHDHNHPRAGNEKLNWEGLRCSLKASVISFNVQCECANMINIVCINLLQSHYLFLFLAILRNNVCWDVRFSSKNCFFLLARNNIKSSSENF